MEDIREALVDASVVEQQPRLEGRNMIMILAPPKK
jgi:translation initiation factor IF-3